MMAQFEIISDMRERGETPSTETLVKFNRATQDLGAAASQPNGRPAIEYDSWARMRQRCSNPNHPQWKAYGGRGVRVMPEWDGFAQFFADMGERPSPAHRIERRDTLRRRIATGVSEANCDAVSEMRRILQPRQRRRGCRRTAACAADGRDPVDDKGGAIDHFGGYWPPGSIRALAYRLARKGS